MKYNQTLFNIIDLFNHSVTIYLVFFIRKCTLLSNVKFRKWGVLSNVNNSVSVAKRQNLILNGGKIFFYF